MFNKNKKLIFPKKMTIYPDKDMHCWEVASGMIIADADHFYTKPQVNSLIGEMSGATSEQVEEMIDESLEDYYDKSETDSIVSDLEAADSAISDAVGNVSSAVSQEAQRAQDAEGELANQIATKADTTAVYTKSETDSLLDAKLDVSAYTPTDLSNYYTKVETNDEINAAVSGKADSSAVTQEISAAVSGKADSSAVTQEISAAVSGKQDTLIAGTNITISGNVISASSGGSGVTPEEVEEMIDSAVSGKADSSAVTEEISAAVSGKADTSAVTEAISAAVSGKANSDSVYTKSETDNLLSGKASTATTQTINNTLGTHTANTAIHVTAQEKTTWNDKSDFSGNYNDLTNKPTIPNYSAGSGITISNNVISAKIWSGTKAQWSQISGNTQADMLYLVYE